MRIAGTKSCSLVNGPGVRYVIFLQGCPHHCEGCHNPETWDFDGGIEVDVVDIYKDIISHSHIDGITLSGGEPFVQESECVELLKMLPPHLSVWIYTGYKYEDICDSELAMLADVIVDGKFDKDNLSPGQLFGSWNQRIITIKKE